MIRSMTGYGHGVVETPGLKVTVELRSVNNRFVDLKLRLPEELTPFEPELRRKILATVKRGRVDADLRIARTHDAGLPLTLKRPVVESALAAFRVLREEYGISGEWNLDAISRVPGLFATDAASGPLDEDGRRAVDAALDTALSALEAERRREGQSLSQDLAARVARMKETVATIRGLAGRLPEALQKKIADRVQQLIVQVTLDPARIAQEAAFLADRSDITEEIVRLEGHLEHARGLLADPGDEPVGKRLEFLLQEIHRETNTIASKSADLGISRQALDLKSEAEKIREQIQNLE